MGDRMLPKMNEQGLTLIEMIFSMVIIAAFSLAFYSLVISFNHHYQVQEAVAAMQQEGRVSADLFVREMRNAGYDPTGELFAGGESTKERVVYKVDGPGDPECVLANHPAERVLEATASSIQFLADLNGDSNINGVGGGPGDAEDLREHIRYEWVGGPPATDHCGVSRRPYTLYRDSGSWMQEVATNIVSFNLSYFDEDGAPIFPDADGDGQADPLLEDQRAAIRQVVIELTAQSEQQDPDYPDNNGYRTRVFSADIRLKNL